MRGEPEAERALYGIAADLLESASPLHHASVALLLAAGVGLTAGEGPFLLSVLLAGSIVAGLVQAYFRLRTGFDAFLFRRIEKGLHPAAFDAAMSSLSLLDECRIGRTAVVRFAGARRLLIGQAVSRALQALCLVAVGAASLSNRHADQRKAGLGFTTPAICSACEPISVTKPAAQALSLSPRIKI